MRPVNIQLRNDPRAVLAVLTCTQYGTHHPAAGRLVLLRSLSLVCPWWRELTSHGGRDNPRRETLTPAMGGGFVRREVVSPAARVMRIAAGQPRARCARTFARLPQRCMEHQRRLLLRESS